MLIVEKDSYYFMGFNVQRFIDSKLQITPFYDYNSGLMEIYSMKSSAGRYQLLKSLLSIDNDAGHVDMINKTIKQNSRLEFNKVRAFRLEPTDFNTGAFDIDGERHPIEKI